MGKVIYIASPYTHDDKSVVEMNFKKVTAFAAALVRQGHVAISPITYGHTLVEYRKMPTDWKFWTNFCISLLAKCDELWVLTIDGHDKSKGVAEEIEYARANDIKVFYIPLGQEIGSTIEPCPNCGHVVASLDYEAGACNKCGLEYHWDHVYDEEDNATYFEGLYWETNTEETANSDLGNALPDGLMDWNTPSLDQMVEYLRKKYMFSSSGDAKCIYHLIEFYDKHK